MLDGLLPLTDPGAVFAVLFLLVLAGPLIAERLRLPAIIGLVLAGMLIGPNVANVLAENTFIDTLGYVGLLYLMFQGGLDLDLDGFKRHRRDSIVFGLATFVSPMVLVTGAAVLMGIDLLAAVIIGSAFASHTLLTYGTVTLYDLSKNRAVTASLGATLIANVAALLVLAVAAAGAAGDSGVLFWSLFTLGLVVYVVVVLVLVPRFTRWFFTGLGQDRRVRLTFLLSGMGVAAVVAGLIGIEPIVGAFLVGLAFNPFVPTGTVIAERVQLLGESVFVPAFLISTGMMLDPRAALDGTTLALAAVLVVAEVVSKLVASEGSGRWMGVTGPERGIMFSLSVGQAAGALAATAVASELDLIGPGEVNAVVLVILASALVAGLSAGRYAPRIEPPDRSDAPLGTRVVVPVANPATVGSLVRVAAQVAAADSGAVVAVNVLPLDARPDQLRAHRDLATLAEKVALGAGSEVTTSVRIDTTPAGGVLHTVVEQQGTALVLGWKGYANAREGFFGSVIDRIVTESPVPVLVCRPGGDDHTGRVVVVLTKDDVGPGSLLGTALAFEVAGRLSRQAEADLVVITDHEEELVRTQMVNLAVDEDDVEIISVEGVLGRLPRLLEPGDVVLTGMPPTASRLGRGARRLARAAADRTVIVAVPH
ncbi:MAG: cation:proton antiporter [Nitriliruptor sp.]|uniref:cation:proton antiporter domain-containing protein n=1 Tax=Nitriliruptor sp. TaxID=2448056 RepID=UPI0034A024BB